MLEQQVALEAPSQRHSVNGTYERLVGYSLGEIIRRVAMEELGLDHYRERLALLGAGAPNADCRSLDHHRPRAVGGEAARRSPATHRIKAFLESDPSR